MTIARAAFEKWAEERGINALWDRDRNRFFYDNVQDRFKIFAAGYDAATQIPAQAGDAARPGTQGALGVPPSTQPVGSEGSAGSFPEGRA